jgi:hypothetical protein
VSEKARLIRYSFEAWQIAHEITKMENETGVRIFPKQREWRADIIGNLVRLPLGEHHKTGNWSKIVKGNIWAVKPTSPAFIVFMTSLKMETA